MIKANYTVLVLVVINCVDLVIHGLKPCQQEPVIPPSMNIEAEEVW